jgi:hypothetical protein
MTTSVGTDVLRDKKEVESWIETGHGDISRIISKLTQPYVDPENPMLHQDELAAQCWFKVAQLVDRGKFERCATRAKFFAIVKVSLRNYIYSLLKKHVYTKKRGGSRNGAHKHVRLDDEDEVPIKAPSELDELHSLLRDFMETLPSQEQLLIQEVWEGRVVPQSSGPMKVIYQSFLTFISQGMDKERRDGKKLARWSHLRASDERGGAGEPRLSGSPKKRSSRMLTVRAQFGHRKRLMELRRTVKPLLI